MSFCASWFFTLADAEKEVPKSTDFENSQSQMGAVYGADQSGYGVDSSQPYYKVLCFASLQYVVYIYIYIY